MKNNHKKWLFAILLILVAISITTTVVYAAYYGRGVFKDVFVNRKHHFESDYLTEIIEKNDAETVEVNTSSETLNIHIYNFDTVSGEYDDFDLEFNVYAWQTEFTKHHSVRIGSNEFTLTSSTPALLVSGIQLDKNKQSTSTIEITFDVDGVIDYSTVPSVCIAVVATSPSYLSGKTLGGNINLTGSAESNIECYFDYQQSDSSLEYAGFKYYIVVSGEPEDESISLKYNRLYLSISPQSITSGITVTTIDETYGRITITLEQDSITKLIFFRTSNSFWDNEASFADCWSTIGALVIKEV